MLTTTNGTGRPDSHTLTHSACLAGRISTARPYVQVRRHHPDGHIVLCGRMTALGGTDRELFKVDTSIGTIWADGRHTKLCDVDGRCTCAAEANNMTTGASTGQNTRQSSGSPREGSDKPTGHPAR